METKEEKQPCSRFWYRNEKLYFLAGGVQFDDNVIDGYSETCQTSKISILAVWKCFDYAPNIT